jgi:DNA mismatch repair protein MutS
MTSTEKTFTGVKLTPMMAQWKECREKAGDALLFFRLGDFYEAFHNDAHIISRELDLTLTERQGVAMCGIPWHTSEGYVEKLVSKGYRVAIAEQIEDPKAGKTLVRREIVRIVSPATLVAASAESSSHNFFAAIIRTKNRWGLACLDVTEARLFVLETDSQTELINELFRKKPKELLIGRTFATSEKPLLEELSLSFPLLLTIQEDWLFEPRNTYQGLCNHFSVVSLDGFGVCAMFSALQAAGGLMHYLTNTLLIPLDHVKELKPQYLQDFLLLDQATIANLEILEPVTRNGGCSLFALMDETQTPMGKRLLASWLKSPLLDTAKISARQDAVAWFLTCEISTHENLITFDNHLKKIRDLERQMYRIKTGLGGPREYVSLANACSQIPYLKQMLEKSPSHTLAELGHRIKNHEEVTTLVRQAFVDSPPFRLSEGGLFRPGYDRELDELGAIKASSAEWLTAYQNQLRTETGIKSIKIGFNRLFGYYIEVQNRKPMSKKC